MAATMKRPRTIQEMMDAEQIALQNAANPAGRDPTGAAIENWANSINRPAQPKAIPATPGMRITGGLDTGAPKFGSGAAAMNQPLQLPGLTHPSSAGNGFVGTNIDVPIGGLAARAAKMMTPAWVENGMGGVVGYTSDRPQYAPDPVSRGIDAWAKSVNRPGQPAPLIREPGVAPLISDPSEYGPPAPPPSPAMRITGGLDRPAPRFGAGAQDIPDVAGTLPAVGAGDRAAESIASGATKAVNALATAYNPMIRKSMGGWFGGRWGGRPLITTPGEAPLISDPSQMGPPEPAAVSQVPPSVMGAQNAAANAPVAAPASAPRALPQDDAHMMQLRNRSNELLRDMYRPGVTPAMHAAMAKERADIESNLQYYRNGLATRTAPAPLSPEQIAASRASLDSQAAGGDGSFQGPIQGADQGMVDKVNASRDARFQAGEKYRAAGLDSARQFGDRFANADAERTAFQEAQAKADVAQQQARGAVAGAVVRSGGLTPEQQVAEATAAAEVAKIHREQAAIEGTGGTTPELAAATQARKQAALDQYGVTDGWRKNVDDALGVLSGGMSDLHSGEVAGNFWGGAESLNRSADLIDNQIGALDRMAASDPAMASEIAGAILNSPNFPATDASGNYLDSKAGGGAILSPGTGFLPENQRSRKALVQKLTSIRQRLLRIKG